MTKIASLARTRLDNIDVAIKPAYKNRPNLQTFGFDKAKPLGPYNFPQFSYCVYRIHGFKRDAAGIKHPVSWTERLPMGQRVRFNKDDYPGIEVTHCERALGGPILK